MAPYLSDSTALASVRHALVGDQRYRIMSAKKIHDAWLVALEGVTTREQAASLAGRELAVWRSELPPLGENEWYAADLVGKKAVDVGGVPLGIVTAVINYGASDILVLDPERMIPLTEGVLREVRQEEGLVVIAPPEAE